MAEPSSDPRFKEIQATLELIRAYQKQVIIISMLIGAISVLLILAEHPAGQLIFGVGIGVLISLNFLKGFSGHLEMVKVRVINMTADQSALQEDLKKAQEKIEELRKRDVTPNLHFE